MADELNAQGLETKSGAELLDEIQSRMQTIFSPNGEEIDFGSNAPDGQLTNVITSMGTAVRELTTTVYNATDPDKCTGTQQDTKYALNYLRRKAGTYTTQQIAITATKTVELQGLDGSYTENSSTAFTVADDNGNNWYLIDSTTVQQGITDLEFRAENIGAVTPTIGTITKMVTILDGITAVINNVGYTILGTEQESDESFRVRRARSQYIASGNNSDKIYSAILDLTGVNTCKILKNRTNEVADGLQPHTIWVVADGGSNQDIAEILYENADGCETVGAVNIQFENLAGQTISMKFDRPIATPYYIKYELYTQGDKSLINEGSIIEALAENLEFDLGQDVDTQTIYNQMPNALGLLSGSVFAQNVLVSRGGSTSVTFTGKNINNVACDSDIFQSFVFKGSETDSSGSYTFNYNGKWELKDESVNLNDYGITYSGEAENGYTITVEYTQGAWSELLQVDTIQTKFTTDENRIYSNIKE